MIKTLRPFVPIVAWLGVGSTLAGAAGPVRWERRVRTGLKPDWNAPTKPWMFQPIIRERDWNHFFQ